MSTEEKEVWLRVYCSVKGRSQSGNFANNTDEDAIEEADNAVENFKKQFDQNVGYRDNAK